MFAQVYEGEHDGESEDAGVDYADDGARAHSRDGRVARCAVEESAILKQMGCVGLEEQEAETAVGECAVRVVGVVPVLECGEVPVDAAD